MERIFTGQRSIDGRREFFSDERPRRFRMPGFRKVFTQMRKEWEAWPEYLNGKAFITADGTRYLVLRSGWRKLKPQAVSGVVTD